VSASPGTTSHTATVDRYLETIYYISAEGDVVRPSYLSSWLGVSAPTVSEALRRLERDGWITTAPDRSVTLTRDGDAIARAIVRRHRILERWLTDVLGFDWAAADVEAERIAGSISDEVVARIDESMGAPVTCPHGNPIPGRDPHHGELRSLAEIHVGESARVRRVSEVAEHEGQPLLVQLAESGVAEGSTVTVVRRDDDGRVEITVGATLVELSARAAGSIWTSPAESA